MKSTAPDLFDDTPAAPAAQPLRNRKREAFCQLLAGEHYDNQTEAYHVAFRIDDRAACRAAASRLMRDPGVSARVRHLRSAAIAELGVDRMWILAKRKYTVDHARSHSDRLRALTDIERSLGLDAPIKIDLNHGGEIGINQTGVIQINDPNGFARIIEAARANRELAAPKTPVFANPS